ncbi:MAG: hypothetical protein HQK66_15695, partial [Desulfamplus sp.]|nr:hypothetical protein [Desulfamplus sp.]
MQKKTLKYFMSKAALLIISTLLFNALSLSALTYGAPVVEILDGPQEGEEIEAGKSVGFTFQATDDGEDLVQRPGFGPLVIIAAGDANTNLNPHWTATENMVKIIYRGFKESMDYTDDDIFLAMGTGSIDINDDSIMEVGVVDHTEMTSNSVMAAM